MLIKHSPTFEVITVEDILPQLDNVKTTGNNQYTALCPVHGDTKNSLSIGVGENDMALVFCHAGCEYDDIIDSLDIEKKDAIKKPQKVVEAYDYVDEDGELLYQTVRFHPKNFGQRRPDGKDGWLYNLTNTRKVLYRLPELINSTGKVYIIEGEKAVDAVRGFGFTATTNPLGGGKWLKEFNKFLKDRDVVIVGDNDATGDKHVQIVSQNLYGIAKSIKILTLEGRKEHEGLDDWLKKNDVVALKEIVDATEPLQLSDDDLKEEDDSLPSYLEGELAVVGALFKNPKLILKIDTGTLNTFFFPKTRIVLKAMLDCHIAGQGVDFITVTEALKKAGKLDFVGGYEQLKKLAKDVPDSLNFENWLSIIESKAQFRSYIKIAESLGKEAKREANMPTQLGDTFLSELHKVTKGKKKEAFIQVSDPIYQIINEAKNRDGRTVTGLATGLYEVDEITAGLQKSDLIIVAGRPSMGKTALAVQMAYNIARDGNTVAFFSLEMSKDQLIKRVLCSEARVNSTDFRTGNLDTNDWNRIAFTIPLMEEAGLYINDTPAISTVHLRNESYKLKQEKGSLDLIVVDYLQLMNQNTNENRFQQISEISRELKSVAKELDVPVLALSQLSRAPESRTPPRPLMSDLRESGQIEQDADVVAFIYRDEYYNPTKEENKGLAEVIFAKQRNGATGTVNLAWLSKFTRFENLLKMETGIKM